MKSVGHEPTTAKGRRMRRGGNAVQGPACRKCRAKARHRNDHSEQGEEKKEEEKKEARDGGGRAALYTALIV